MGQDDKSKKTYKKMEVNRLISKKTAILLCQVSGSGDAQCYGDGNSAGGFCSQNGNGDSDICNDSGNAVV